MFFAIGFVLAIVWAFVNPYLFASLENSTLLTSVTTALGLLVFIEGGRLLDRRRKKAATSRARP